MEYRHIMWYIWGSLVVQLVKNPPAMQETPFISWVGKIHWRRDRLPTPVSLSFPCGSAGKESACNVGDLGLNLELGRSPSPLRRQRLFTPVFWPREFHGLYGVTKSRTRLGDFHSLFTHFDRYPRSLGPAIFKAIKGWCSFSHMSPTNSPASLFHLSPLWLQWGSPG